MGYDARNTEFGTKRSVVGAHYGLKDWLAQRITAVILASYSIILPITLVLVWEQRFFKVVYAFLSFLGRNCNASSDGGDLLPRLGWGKGYLDGLHKTGW